jgi:hypothetical protein
VSEGLSGTDVGKELAEHAKHSRGHDPRDRRDRLLSVAEAVLLSLVTLAAAWSGFAAAKWSGESAVLMTVASEARTDASRADLDAREDRNFDLSTFEAWFDAYVADDQQAMAIAERRFRPEFAVAFKAWRATNPDTNPAAPQRPDLHAPIPTAETRSGEGAGREGGRGVAAGVSAGQTSDNYLRVTVFLASVLFLVGISTHFPSRGVRYALIALSAAVLLVALVQLAQLPRTPS